MENKITLEELESLIDNKNVKEIRDLFESTDIIDIAEVCDDIEDISKLLFIFKTVKSEYTAELFTYIYENKKKKLINLF